MMAYGRTAGDQTSVASDDMCTVSIDLGFRVPFLAAKYRKIHICPNGLICFKQAFSGFSPPRFGRGYSPDFQGVFCIAPYFADLVAKSNQLFYQSYDFTEIINADVSGKVKGLVKVSYGKADFKPIYALKVTWDAVGRFGAPADNVTFQVVFTSDGTHSYSFNSYKYGGMKDSFGSPFIGYITDGNYVGLDNTADGSLLREADRNLVYNGQCTGAVSFDYTASTNLEEDDRLRCKLWHKKEISKASLYKSKAESMPECPCFLDWLWWDRSFSLWDYTLYSNNFIHVPMEPRWRSGSYGKSCAYDVNGRFFIGFGQEAGTFASVNPLIDSRSHQLEDLHYRTVCCEKTDLCNLYWEVRPLVSRCYSIFPFSLRGRGSGDPHFNTLDGANYTFNGHGEYMMLKITDENANLEIQCRTQRAKKATGDLSDATVFSGFAIQGDGVWMQVELNEAGNRAQLFVGTNKSNWVDYTSDFYNNATDMNIKAITGLTVARDKSEKTTSAIFVDAGVTFNVTEGTGLLQMAIAMPNALKNKNAVGLLGNYNDNDKDDFKPRGQNTSLSSPTERQVFENFGSTWMTSTQESIFKYGDGLSHADFIQANFTPKFLEEANATLRAEAEQKCNGNLQCVFDLVFTGNEKLAMETGRTETQAELTNKEASNQIPNITVVNGAELFENQNYLILKVNEAKTITVKGADDGDTLNFSVLGDSGAKLGEQADKSVNITLTVTDTTPKNLSVTVIDNKNVSAPMLEFVLVVCPLCSGHGTCDTSLLREDQGNANYKIATCICESYWTGDDCQLDFNACAENPCSIGRNCTDRDADQHKVNSSLTAYTCTPCPTGFEEKNNKCEDIDECASKPCGANATCVNTEGSFSCVCTSGFRLSSTNKTMCNDINECEESTSGCDQICTNTPGSVSCSCYAGYTYNSTTKTCVQDTPPDVCKDKCKGTGGCVNENGTAKCFCKAGYKLNDTSTTCQDIDECTVAKTCSQNCTNIEGSFQCGCYDGYKLGADKITCEVCQFPNYGTQCSKTCQCGAGSDRCDTVRGCVCKQGWNGTNCATDINECDTPNKCGDANKVCTNTIGSYACICRAGFEEENGTCVDINECDKLELNTCAQNCNNTVGGFSCSCREGYVVNATNPTQCKDFDECAAGVSGCQHMCLNSVGRFSCACYFGFELEDDRKKCVLADDVCKKEFPDNGCSDICRADLQTKSYQCLCNNGYKLGADNKTCIDIDECQSNSTNECTQTCENTKGGYQCKCKTGFKLANDKRTCDVCDAFHYGDNCVNECNCGVGAERCDSVTGCVCNQGWSGNKCDVDQDECADANKCPGTNTVCTNNPGSYQCGCMTGFKNGGANCVDINECVESNDCRQTCTNTVGSYECSCNAGYVKNGKNCTDIDECTNGQAGCAQVCTNTDGGVRCSCNEFYKLASDKKACLPQTECKNVSYCTQGVCAVINAKETCTCNAGFKFKSGNETECEDIPECDTNPCTQSCSETEGSYKCGCNQTGYKLDEDKKTCIKCPAGNYGANCTLNCLCVKENTQSCAFDTGNCTCKAGWEGAKCDQDINECNATQSPCPANSTCENNNGSYVCNCNAGYIKSGDGTCQVCPSWKYGTNCASNCSCFTTNSLSCSNTAGTCACKTGWTGNVCTTDVDECKANANLCDDPLKTCKNLDGSYTCVCKSGFTLTSGVCTDINECLEGTHNCTQTCTNAVGGFECGCNPGFSGTGNNCVACVDGKWGVQCNMTCECVTANTAKCDKISGCKCKTGWEGTKCNVDINECTAGTNNCRLHSTCANTNGSFTCPCDSGYTDVGGICAACSNNTYGAGCNTLCNCNASHALSSTQTCNHLNGTCVCNAQWTGATCDTDADECTLGTHNCSATLKKFCHNTVGGFNCSCLRGFKEETTGACVEEMATTTTLAPNQDGVAIFIKINIDKDKLKHLNFSVKATFDVWAAKVSASIMAYYKTSMGNALKNVIVNSLKFGSLDVNATLIKEDSKEASQTFTQASQNLNNASLTLDNESYASSLLAVAGVNIDTTKPPNELKCVIFLSDRGQCDNNYACVVVDGQPSCEPVKTDDDLGLVLGLGIGIPLFLIACLVVAVIIIYAVRNRSRKFATEDYERDSFNNGFFTRGMPVKIDTWGRKDPLYKQHSRHWDSSSTSTASDEDRKRRRHNRDYDYAPQERNVYDNQPSNFSWDFLYNYIGPNERYHIQRPQTDSRPHPAYDVDVGTKM